jgi:hypothetical protein
MSSGTRRLTATASRRRGASDAWAVVSSSSARHRERLAIVSGVRAGRTRGPLPDLASVMPVLALVTLLAQLGEPDRRYTAGGFAQGVVIVVVLILLYFLPSMLAIVGGKRRKWRIVAINVLAGWTIVGWFAAMLMNWAYEPPDGATDGEAAGATDRSNG